MVTAAAVTIISDRATIPATVILPDSLDTRIAFVAAVSAAPVAVSAAAIVAVSAAAESAAAAVAALARAEVVSMAVAEVVSMAVAEDTAVGAEDTAVRFPNRGLRGTRPARTDLPGARYGAAL